MTEAAEMSPETVVEKTDAVLNEMAVEAEKTVAEAPVSAAADPAPAPTPDPVVYGIKETKELLKFVLDLGMGLEQALADKKMTFGDVGCFLVAFKDAVPAFAGINLVPKEMGNLSDAEIAELVTFVETEFHLNDQKIEHIVDMALSFGFKIYEMIEVFRGLKKA